MLEITSIISLDFFELVTFVVNYGLQAADKDITVCTKVALGYFGTFPAKRRLQMIETLVVFSENLTLQNAPGVKVQPIEIRRFWRPLCSRNETRNLLFKPLFIDAC